MKDKYFIDTNIFVYSFAQNEPDKQRIAREIIHNALKKQNGCISSQVMQEFLNVATRKFNSPLSREDSLRYLDTVLTPLCEVYVSLDLLKKTIDISKRWHCSFYDAMIVAGALQARCSVLHSEDLQHGQRIESLVIVNPFLSA